MNKSMTLLSSELESNGNQIALFSYSLSQRKWEAEKTVTSSQDIRLAFEGRFQWNPIFDKVWKLCSDGLNAETN